MTRRNREGLTRWIGVGALVLVAGFFSFLNTGERVTVNLGFTVLYRLSLVGLVFGVFLLGMITMFLFGLRHDRRVRDSLRGQYAEPDVAFYTPPEPPM